MKPRAHAAHASDGRLRTLAASSPPGIPRVPEPIDPQEECDALRRDQAVLALGLSHELRAPLRAIESFSFLLEQHEGGKLDDKGREHLRRIRDASARMARLLARLQAYLHAGTAPLRPGEVDLSLLAEWSAGELREASPAREAHVDIAPGMRAHGDERLLRAVVQELMHNAWMFTPADRAVHLQVDAQRTDAGTTLGIADRGIGLDPTHAARLGEPFQRLHAAMHPEGCGVGLAIAQRIAARHGGRVTLEGRPGEGTTARVFLPDPADDKGTA